MPHPLQFESKKGWICVAWVWNREGIKKLVNGKQHSIWFVPTGMNGLPQNVLLNFWLEFPKSDLTIYLPSRISKIFCQMVSTPYLCSKCIPILQHLHLHQSWNLKLELQNLRLWVDNFVIQIFKCVRSFLIPVK